MEAITAPSECLIPVTIRVPRDVLERVQILAKLQSKPSASVVRELLVEALNKRSPELNLLESIRETTRTLERQTLVTLENVITIKDTLLPALMLMFPEEFRAVAGKLSDHIKDSNRQRHQKALEALAEAVK